MSFVEMEKSRTSTFRHRCFDGLIASVSFSVPNWQESIPTRRIDDKRIKDFMLDNLLFSNSLKVCFAIKAEELQIRFPPHLISAATLIADFNPCTGFRLRTSRR